MSARVHNWLSFFLLNVVMLGSPALVCCRRQELHENEEQITKAHFLEYWSSVDADKSGTITKAEVQAAVKKSK